MRPILDHLTPTSVNGCSTGGCSYSPLSSCSVGMIVLPPIITLGFLGAGAGAGAGTFMLDDVGI